MSEQIEKYAYLDDDETLIVNKVLACALGLQASIVYRQLHFWIKTYRKANKEGHYRDGAWWIYNTYEGWQAEENFPFWGISTIRRHVKTLEDLGLIVSTSKYNKKPYDDTKWYAIDYKTYIKFLAFWHDNGSPNHREKGTKNKPKEYDEFIAHWKRVKPEAPLFTMDSGSSEPVVHNEHPPLFTMDRPIPETTTETTTEREDAPSVLQNEKPMIEWSANQWIGTNEPSKLGMASKFRKYDDGKALEVIQHPSNVKAVFYAWLRALGDKRPATLPEQLWRENFKQCEQLVLHRITPYEVYSYVTEQYKDAFWNNKVVSIDNVAKNIQAWKAQPAQANGANTNSKRYEIDVNEIDLGLGELS